MSKVEIIEVSEICPDTTYTIRVMLLSNGETFEVHTYAKELVNGAYDFVLVSQQNAPSDKTQALKMYQTIIDQIASLDSLE